jgi:hypothetical protein
LSTFQVAGMFHLYRTASGRPAHQLLRHLACHAQWLPSAPTGTLPVQRPGHSVAVWRPGNLLPRRRLHLAGTWQMLVTIMILYAPGRAFKTIDTTSDVGRPSCHGASFTVSSYACRSGPSTLRPSAKSWRRWRALPGMPPGLRPTALGSCPALSWRCTGRFLQGCR